MCVRMVYCVLCFKNKNNAQRTLNPYLNISGTPFFIKQYTSLQSSWLLLTVDPYPDKGQCGGLNRSSILITSFNFYIFFCIILIDLSLKRLSWPSYCILIDKALCKSGYTIFQICMEEDSCGGMFNLFYVYLYCSFK